MNAIVQRDKVESFKAQVAHRESEFRMALPAHIPVERFMRVVNTAVTGNPDLLNADRVTLFQSAMKAAQDGLLPDGRDGALVIFAGKVQWMPMIGGILKKVRNSGELLSISAYVAYSYDEFTYELGDEEKIIHRPALDERGKPRLVYAIAKTKDGGIYREVMTVAEVEKVRNVSRAKNTGPWKDWWDEMAKKTVLRRLAKRLPMSTDLDDLIRRDDALYDFDGAREHGKTAAPTNGLAGRLEALAGDTPAAPTIEHDLETGEITKGQQNTDGQPQPELSVQAAGEEAGDDRPSEDSGTPAADTILDKARSKAVQGRKKFNLWFTSLSDAERDGLQGHVKGLLAAADAADGGA